MAKTVVEKILSAHCGRDASYDEIVVCDIDFLMASDTTGSLAIKAFLDMGGKRVANKGKIVFILDHAAPAPNRDIANTHKLIRNFAGEQDIRLFEVGSGICHQLIIENGFIKPGQILLGADSHSCIYGAIGAFGSGIGSSDLAVAMLTGRNWLKVPRTIKVVMKGSFAPGVYAKDFIIDLIGRLGANGAYYMSFEFDSEHEISFDQKMTICNMVVECGAKSGLFYNKVSKVFPDLGCVYEKTIEMDLDTIQPMVSKPNSVDNVDMVTSVVGTKIQQGFLGSCTNGQIEDLREAAKILAGKHLSKGCRLIVTPASTTILKQAFDEGVMQLLLDAGATLTSCGCGACVGTHGGIPADDETVISSANRNFLGRMGNPNANIYLASPATVAVSVLKGEITDPREVFK